MRRIGDDRFERLLESLMMMQIVANTVTADELVGDAVLYQIHEDIHDSIHIHDRNGLLMMAQHSTHECIEELLVGTKTTGENQNGITLVDQLFLRSAMVFLISSSSQSGTCLFQRRRTAWS